MFPLQCAVDWVFLVSPLVYVSQVVQILALGLGLNQGVKIALV